MKNIPYKYQKAPIPGGGYVTGFLFDKTNPDVLYCRTDIGGAYRFDTKKQIWMKNQILQFLPFLQL